MIIVICYLRKHTGNCFFVVYICLYLFRCKICFTKNWCSLNCFNRDKETHKLFCDKDAPARKKKGDRQDRRASWMARQRDFVNVAAREVQSWGNDDHPYVEEVMQLQSNHIEHEVD